MSSDVESRDRHLRVAAIAFAIGSGLHIIDHLRRGQGSITETLYVLGNAALVLQVVTIVLVLTRHRLAPIGAGRWFSSIASTAEIAGALAVGITGLAVVRARGLASFAVGVQQPGGTS